LRGERPMGELPFDSLAVWAPVARTSTALPT
jgi:hypothetical protein